MRRVELLSPARDLAVGMEAIRNGADAVYIGAPAFGARKAAANSLEDIRTLAEYAHRYDCRVFVTLNTLLYDHELAAAERMIRDLYAIGTDALIVQDMGILRMDLPPICLHASTQMHNYDLERIKFIERMGFRRIVLARELSLEQIREIRREVKAELEVFVHGALCVSLSGQCYLSQYMFGRSANRGECAQPCRMHWSVEDAGGKRLVDERYILSLKDLNLTAYIKDLVDIGVDSFKIEGRLKDEHYVANVTAHYSSLLDALPGVQRVGAGRVTHAFVPEPERSFNRGYSTYFMRERERGLVNPDTPKSMGKFVGHVAEVRGNRLRVEGGEELHNGDGLCYLQAGELRGIKVNRVADGWAECNEKPNVPAGTSLYRNYDHQYTLQLERNRSERRIPIYLTVDVQKGRLVVKAGVKPDGAEATVSSEEVFEVATNPSQQDRLKSQLMKCGDTEFVCEEVEFLSEEVLFVPAAAANALRRRLIEALRVVRQKRRVLLVPGQEEQAVGYPGTADWRLNAVNEKAVGFYRGHGVAQVEPGLEKRLPASPCSLMRTRYCILYELGRCRKQCGNEDLQFPLVLCNDKHRFRLEFDCARCFMNIIL